MIAATNPDGKFPPASLDWRHLPPSIGRASGRHAAVRAFAELPNITEGRAVF